MTSDDIDWKDPAARARLAERLGPEAYNAAAEAHRRRTVQEVVNGHEIRLTETARWGRLYAVGDSGVAFPSIDRARQHAREMKTGEAK